MVDSVHAKYALEAPCQGANDYKEELEKFQDSKYGSEDDEDMACTSPTYFFRKCNFFRRNILQEQLYPYRAHQFAIRNNDRSKKKRNSGRGRRCDFSTFDSLFITITALKGGYEWEFLEFLFQIKLRTFQRMVKKFLEIWNSFSIIDL